LAAILDSADPRFVIYIYRVDRERGVVRPYLAKCAPCTAVLSVLRDRYGAGAFWLLIRHGRTMVLSGEVLVEKLR
jgi:hypothetical protein